MTTISLGAINKKTGEYIYPKVANKKGLITFCFSGNNGGTLKKSSNYSIIIPSNITSITQVAEIALGQIFCEIIENNC